MPHDRGHDRQHDRHPSFGSGNISAPSSAAPNTPANHNGHTKHSTPSHHSSMSSASSSRKPSIVEILSSPPPLPVSNNNDDVNSINLSRASSVSSRSNLEFSDVQLTELVSSNKLISINCSYSIQKAFETLAEHNLTSVPVSTTKTDSHNLGNCLTFDYSDLNTYLLLIMNKIHMTDLDVDDITPEIFENFVAKAKKGEEVPVEFIIKLHPKNPFITVNESDNLLNVMEILGNGVHRIAITNNNGQINGVLSQRRLIRYIWDNARRFPYLEYYLNQSIEDLKIGSTNPITIYGDNQLIEALHKMFTERVTSLAVIDRKGNLLGNISIVDVKNISSTKNSHLLFKSVLNFIGYNLSQKGIEEGKDQFPIFHVNNYTGLGRIIAKLVATELHRLWVVEAGNNSNSNSIFKNFTNEESNENGLPGKLIGVITLTDIIGFLASIKATGTRKIDPQFARNQRRRSSTSTTRSSLDNSSNLEVFRK